MKSKDVANPESIQENIAHAFFLLQDGNRLAIPKGLDDYSIWHYLSHRIVRRPSDLHSHTRRVLICRRPSLTLFLAGALHDLFLVLGNNGSQLRTHLFEASQLILNKSNNAYFQQWFIEQRRPHSENLQFSGALLSNAALGKQSIKPMLVRKRRQPSTRYQSVLQEVEDRINQGQISIAKALLEDTLAEGNSDSELKNRLIEIYRHEQNWESVEKLSLNSAKYELHAKSDTDAATPRPKDEC